MKENSSEIENMWDFFLKKMSPSGSKIDWKTTYQFWVQFPKCPGVLGTFYPKCPVVKGLRKLLKDSVVISHWN